eukprot:GHVS01021967.1.p1 GENE.GHVS01021967.1~~GHVS01021967.1.p1  ORF type:complete len:212 (-),score=29.46 GHVS01021967.1:225-860(-)
MQNINVGDIVVYRWAPWELQRYSKAMGYDRKFLPSWSEPCKVIEVLHSGTQLKLVSLWYERNSRRVVSGNDVQRLTRDDSTAALNDWKIGFHGEVKRMRGLQLAKGDQGGDEKDEELSGLEGLQEPINWDLLSDELSQVEAGKPVLGTADENRSAAEMKRRKVGWGDTSPDVRVKEEGNQWMAGATKTQDEADKEQQGEGRTTTMKAQGGM